MNQDLRGRDCHELGLRHCTPAWAAERDSISKKYNKIKRKGIKRKFRPCEQRPGLSPCFSHELPRGGKSKPGQKARPKCKATRPGHALPGQKARQKDKARPKGQARLKGKAVPGQAKSQGKARPGKKSVQAKRPGQT